MATKTLLALVNELGQTLHTFGVRRGEWNTSELLATELGGDPPELQLAPALERLIAACHEEAALSTVGRIAMRRHIVELLRNLSRVCRARENNDAIDTERIEKPVFITGLPRTGSSFLHALLERDPANRVPYTHEVMRPPAASCEQNENRRYCKRRLRWADRLVPEFRAVHPIGAHLPEECIAITAYTFRSIVFHTTGNVPAFQDWLEKTDLGVAYRFHRRFLQQLQHFGGKGRWVLKAPGHMFGIRALADVYPDATIVHIHRDPSRVAASLASHTTILRRAFSDQIDPAGIAADWLDRWWRALDELLDFRALLRLQAIDVYYGDLVPDPIAAVESLYSQLGWRLSEEARESMTHYLSTSVNGAHNGHRYSPTKFGIDAAEIRTRTARYRSHFDIPDEPL